MLGSIKHKPINDKPTVDPGRADWYNSKMSKFNEDRNIIGRVGALAVIVAVAFGLHRLGCGTGEMCPVMKTDSCCSGEAVKPAAK